MIEHAPEDGPAPAPPAGGAARAVVTAALVLLAVLAVALAWDDVRAHRDATQQTRRAAELSGQLAAQRARADRLDGQLAALPADNGRLRDVAAHPTLSMWNACGGPCAIGPGAVRVGSVPDTFQLLISFKADVPVDAYVFTFHQWTQFDGCGLSVRCVTGSYRAFDPATSVDTTFDEAEGCSGYVWVLRSDTAGTIQPDIRVRYQPADHPTGVCTTG
jgi:hypothetical protein